MKWWQFCFTTIICLMANVLFAVSASAMSVRPGIIETIVKPGATQSIKIEIGNDEPTTQTYTFSIQKFTGGADGSPQFLPPTDLRGLPQWIKLDLSSITIAPGKVQALTFTITPPSDATPGGNYAAFLISQHNASSTGGTVGIAPRIGVLLLVTVDGQLHQASKMSSFKAQTSGFGLPIELITDVENQGQTHIQPMGHITIKNLLGRTVADLPLNHDRTHILPGEARELVDRWQLDAADQSSWLSGWRQEWNPFLIGPYTAELHIDSPSSTQPQTTTTHFWVLPWRTLLATGLALCVIIGLISRRSA